MGGSSCGVKALRDMLFDEKIIKENFLYLIIPVRTPLAGL